MQAHDVSVMEVTEGSEQVKRAVHSCVRAPGVAWIIGGKRHFHSKALRVGPVNECNRDLSPPTRKNPLAKGAAA